VATNSIGEGRTREISLDRMVDRGFTITRAIKSRSWAAPGAALEVAVVWGTLAKLPDELPRYADDVPVAKVTNLLEPAGRVEGKPIRLKENAGIVYEGCKVGGKGFVLSEAEAQEWIAADPRNAEVIFPYLNGDDLNSRPDASPSRWVIDFNDRTEAEARLYPLPYRRLLETVKLERATNNRKLYRDIWWQYSERRPGLRKAISKFEQVLVIARVSKTVMPIRVKTGPVFSDAVNVFAIDSFSDQAVLSSSLHQLWAITYASTLETRVRYTPSDVFETFPRPEISDNELAELGLALDEERREMMLRRNLGLTNLYNLVNDPSVVSDSDISRLRDIHIQIDNAMLRAYGWQDIELAHGFYIYRQAERFSLPPAVRREVLDRLLRLNHQRADDSLQGVGQESQISLTG